MNTRAVRVPSPAARRRALCITFPVLLAAPSFAPPAEASLEGKGRWRVPPASSDTALRAVGTHVVVMSDSLGDTTKVLFMGVPGQGQTFQLASVPLPPM